MSNLRQAAQQALEALEERYVGSLRDRAIEALEAALAEPDYWQEEARRYAGNADYWRKRYKALAEPECKCTMRQKMVGDGCAVCNPERAKDLAEPQTTHWEGCEAVHPECKTEQGPDGISWLKRDSGYFTAPTPRKPLTDEEIVQVLGSVRESITGNVFLAFARAIEHAHGIGGQT